MICQRCNVENRDDCVYCVGCGHSLAYNSPEAPGVDGTSYSTMRGQEQRGLGPKPQRYAVGKNPFTATVLAFLPPFGPIYNDDYKKAVFVAVFIYPMLLVPMIGVVVATLVYVWNIANTHQVAKRQKALW